MKVVLFYHSLVSDWNHGNAHFLRGVVGELIARGHETAVYEPSDAWSVQNLLAENGPAPIEEFHARYPTLRSHRYELAALDLDQVLDGADLVIVHEWNSHDLVRRVGEHRAGAGARYRLFFHDTHHRAVTAPEQMLGYQLSNYDGVLAYGNVLRDLYRSWGRRAWTWHEAADTRTFFPLPHPPELDGDLVWIGNWGDNERGAELREFLIEPVAALNLPARVYGVRYPKSARAELSEAGIEYGGWLPNYRAPEAFARFRVTVHVPRRPYVEALPGIPTIRPFEALACGIPLVSSPWDDVEGLFEPGRDYLVARDGGEMKKHLRALLSDPQMASEFTEHGLDTIRSRHTCAHRVDELLGILKEVNA